MSDELNRIRKLSGLNEFLEPPEDDGWDDGDDDGTWRITDLIGKYPEIKKIFEQLDDALQNDDIVLGDNDEEYIEALLKQISLNPYMMVFDHHGNYEPLRFSIRKLWTTGRYKRYL